MAAPTRTPTARPVPASVQTVTPPFEWEQLDKAESSAGHTERARVLGGWLVRTYGLDTKASITSMAMVFVPDADGEWFDFEGKGA